MAKNKNQETTENFQKLTFRGIKSINLISVVETSFDKVISHLFIGSINLMTQEAQPWLAPSEEILKI